MPNRDAPKPWSTTRRVCLAGAAVCTLLGLMLLALFVRSFYDEDGPPVVSTSPTESDGASPQDRARIDVPAAAPAVAWRDLDDPRRDGWESEALYQQVQAQLDKISALIQDPAKIDTATCAEFVDASYRGRAAEPAVVQPVFDDASINVERAEPAEPSERGELEGDDAELSGPAGFAAALRHLASKFKDAGPLHVKFKVFDVDMASDFATTREYLSIAGQMGRGMIEQHATWSTRWRRSAGEEAPKLSRLEVVEFEQARSAREGGTLFSDCTPSVLQGDDCYLAQVLQSYNAWLNRCQDKSAVLGNPGVAVGDVDGDGLDDLYVCQEGGWPNLLLLAQGDGTVRNAAPRWQVDWLHNSRGALLVDWDNDGDQDLAVGLVGGVILASNEGARFQIRTILPTGNDTMSLSAADYDNDGRLDLYVCVYAPGVDRQIGGAAIQVANRSGRIFYDSNEGAPNALFRNLGGWRFREVTRDVGLDQNNRRYSFAAAWEDFDNDGDQDLYVANDYGRNNLYRNDATAAGRAFVDVAAAAEVEDSAAGMSVAWGDYDRDGWIDLYVSNMFSSAGGRITSQPQFQRDAPPEVRAIFRRFARGNSLFRNRGENRFQDVSAAAGVTVGRWAWSSIFVDVNNDGWQDLLVANGYITNDDSSDL